MSPADLLAASRTQVVVGDSASPDDIAERLRQKLGTAAIIGANPHMHISTVRATVIEELALGLEQHGVAPAEMQQRCQHMLRRLGLEQFALHDPTKLSGGQTRRLVLGAVALTQPETLVVCDPFAGLDPGSRDRVREIFADLESSTIIAVSGDSMAELADDGWREIRLSPKEAEQDANATGVSAQPPEWSSGRIDPGAPIPVTAVAGRHGGEPPRHWWQLKKRQPHPEFNVGPVDLPVRSGAVVWLRGANGTGKSTLLRAAAGLDGSQRAHPSITLVLQDPVDQIAESTVRNFVGAEAVVAELGLDGEEHPLDLAPGPLRAAQVAAAACRGCEVTLLDEPDVGAVGVWRDWVLVFIRRMIERGGGVVITSHDPSLCEDISRFAAVEEVWL